LPAAWSPLAQEALDGRRRELQLLAADGLLPLAPEELLALQVRLAAAADADAAERARRALRAYPPPRLAGFAAQDADEEDLRWLFENLDVAGLREAVLGRRSTPAALLEQVAPALSPALQETLLLRQDRIVERPSILDRLSENPQLTPFARRRIAEYRDHLVPSRPAADPEDEVAAVEDEATESEAEAAIAAARQPGPGSQGDVEEHTGLTEGQIRALPPRVRIRLARRAGAAMRQILLRDPHPRVALAVLKGPMLSDAEVEQIARSRSVLEDVLEAISRRREWARKYAIVLALCSNPRTPVAAAVRLIPQLGMRDLRTLGRDRNVSDAVRAHASRLYMIKSK
jgi:hypothetical protein